MRPTTNAKGHVILIASGLLCAVAAFLLLASESAVATVSLPDGRAWEMVSLLEKNGGEINGIDGATPDNGLPEGGVVQASAVGDSITYLSLLAFPDSSGSEPLGAPIASQYLSTRGPTSWSTHDITAAVNSKTYPPAGSGAPYKAFSSDLSIGLMLNGEAPAENPVPPLAPGAFLPPPGYQNYYSRNNASGKFEAMLTSAPSEEPSVFFLELLGVTPDLGHVVVGTPAALAPVVTPQAEGNLYEWASGKPHSLRPINILPGVANLTETASGISQLGMGHNEDRTISADGSRVFWSQESVRTLFVRENIGQPQSPIDGAGRCAVLGDACTVQVDATKIAEPKEPKEEGGFGVFREASVSGSKVFFTDRRRLTPDSTAGTHQREDLYLFDVDTGRLTDLTVDNGGEGASVIGVLGASEDGSYIYFIAEGALPGTGATASGENLYVWHGSGASEGTTRFIATLSSNDSGHTGFHDPGIAHDWALSTGERTTRVGDSGQRLVFMSSATLTGYDNRDAVTGRSDEEVYLYDASSNVLTCVSCNPGGLPPHGPSGVPGGTAWQAVGEKGTYQSRALSDDGSRVFFDGTDALVPQDTNGAQDVYEWEQDGAGTCQRIAGCIYLLSGAADTSEASFVDASANGNDAFFITRAQLVGQDLDQLRDLYDARVDGGFASPRGTPPTCEGESCLPPSSSLPSLGSPISATFVGVGNLVPSRPATQAKPKKLSKPKKPRKRAGKKHGRGAKASTGRGRDSRNRGRR